MELAESRRERGERGSYVKEGGRVGGLTDTLQQLGVAVVREERRLQAPEVELQHAGHRVQVTLAVRQRIVSCRGGQRGKS